MNYSVLFELCIISVSLCEISIEKKENLLNAFIDYYNNLPDQDFTCDEGVLQNAQETNDHTYHIQVNLKVSNNKKADSTKILVCSATVQDRDNGFSAEGLQCEEQENDDRQENADRQQNAVSGVDIERPTSSQTEVTEPTFERKPVQLNNEIEANTAVTSGEQFIAIPRERPSNPCVGCSSHVNPQAAGVSELAGLGVRHLDRHDPNARHTLNSILDVERQVQVVNGVRYILTLLIDFNNCTETESDMCASTKACKISVLVKPWVKLPSGSKYKAILANNCTEEWQYGDDGEVLPEDSDNRANNQIDSNPSKTQDVRSDDDIKVIHSSDTQSQPNHENIITEEEIKDIEGQIIPIDHFEKSTAVKVNDGVIKTLPDIESEQHVEKEETVKYDGNTLSSKPKPITGQQQSMNPDKMKAIDDMLDFFNFSGFDPKTVPKDGASRTKRSYDIDLQALSLAENYNEIKNRLENAKYIYSLAQAMVNYLNEQDISVKNRVLKNVLTAEDELENHQHFVYVQARVVIPCDKAECGTKDTIIKICNGAIDSTNDDGPQILSAFCYDDYKEKSSKSMEVPLNDPVLKKLVNSAVKKIESDSTSKHAITVNRIVGASTRHVSGILTKISVIISFLNCNKSVPLALRDNCTVIKHLGSSICEIIFLQRKWLKDEKISYTCTDIPIDVTFSQEILVDKSNDNNDPKVIEMLQEALQQLEIQSNKNNKQKIVKVKSISSQILSGFLTKIEFLVGYTTCTNNNDINQQSNACEILPNERLRSCIAEIWDRTWLEDGRQMEVTCNDTVQSGHINNEKSRKKRSLKFTGGQTKLNVSDPQYEALAVESLQKFMNTSSDKQHYAVITVDNVTVQVVSGKKTRITFTISPTNCQLNSDGTLSSSKCDVVDSKNVVTCKSVILEQLWLDNKQINVTCQNFKGLSRSKRHIHGGFEIKNSNDPKYMRMAQESFETYLISSSSHIPENFKINVTKVSEQVVTTSFSKIDFVVSWKQNNDDCLKQLLCHSEITDAPWLGQRNINVDCKRVRAKKGLCEQRNQGNNTNIQGGLTEQNPNDPKYKTLAEESLEKYLADSGNLTPFEVTEVIKVTTQVVSGSKTRIEFKGSPLNQNAGNIIITCSSEIWEQAWRNIKEITISCSIDARSSQVNSREKRHHIVGGLTEQDPNDPKYKALAEESLRKYLADSGNQNPFEVTEVMKVTTQVVSGSKTKIEFKSSPLNQNAGNIITCSSEIWEQAWRNKKEITVSCTIDARNSQVNSREKRHHIVGGLTEQDPNDPKYKALAEESLRKYLADSGNQNPFEVTEVMKVTTQVVSGSKTRIEFKSSPLNQNAGNIITCSSEIWEQAWRNKKEITVSCTIDARNSQVNSREKRHHIVGGLTEQDPNDPKYKALAEESLRKYLVDSGNQNPFEVTEVMKVTTQVVSGSKTKIEFKSSPLNQNAGNIITCSSEIWEQAWRNKKEITVSCTNDARNSQVNSREKRHHIVGGLTEQNPNDPKYKALAEESLRKYLADSENQNPFEVTEVIKVTTQVVSGSKTRIEFKGSPLNQNAGNIIITCSSEIWEQAWRNKKEINITCNMGEKRADRVKRGVPGGREDQNTDDPKYQELAEESLKKYLADSGNPNSYKVIRVTNVTTQIVSGILTKIVFTVSPSSKNDSDVITCNSEIWEKPWFNKTEIQTINCNIIDQNREFVRNLRKKRSLIGGRTQQNIGDPKYHELAEESLQKYLTDNGNVNPHKVIRVTKVTTKVVSGSLTTIEFIVSPLNKANADDIVCQSTIWQQPWLSKKDIDVDCNVEVKSTRTNTNAYNSRSNLRHSKRPSNLIGSSKVMDPKDNKYKLLAEESLRHYERKHKAASSRVMEVKSVEKRLVAGTLYIINYIAEQTACNNSTEKKLLYCSTKIWDKAWLKQKKIYVSCYSESEVYDEGEISSDIHTKIKNVRELDGNNISKDKRKKRGIEKKREVRQISNDMDEYIDEDTTQYYANRAVHHLNDRSRNNHLHKLVTIHAVQNSIQMKTNMVRMYIEVAETFCLKHQDELYLKDCEEMDGLNHKLCLVRLWPSPDDELVVMHISVVCDDEEDFQSISGLYIAPLLRMSILEYERSPDVLYKTVHQGEPNMVPSFDSRAPIVLHFLLASTNCTKDIDLNKLPAVECYIDTKSSSKPCTSFIWLVPNTKVVKNVTVKCNSLNQEFRSRRSISVSTNLTTDEVEIQKMVTLSLQKLEMESLQRYKQRLLQINSHSTKITSGKVTTIDFDVGYTSCLKYEWVENITSCDFLEHLPRRHCVALIWERLWLNNGRNIDVKCEDDETPLEAHIEFQSAEMAMELAKEALKHIEFKYPHPSKQKIVRIFSLEKQVIAGIHYRMKVEVGLTDCSALGEKTDCKLLDAVNKFCRINVWLRPWTDHPPNYRVSCDYQDSAHSDLYRNIQAEHLFHEFITTYNPYYVNDHSELRRRFEIFKTNVGKIHELNIHEKGTARYGVTRFADLSYEEFALKNTGLKPSLRDENQIPMRNAGIPSDPIPELFDWREHGAVTDVKDQGSCGSCWAFSVTGNIEGQWKLQTGQLLSLSEQELVDCDKLDKGCDGGLPDNAYRAIEQLGGLETENDYPYEAEDDKCVFNKSLTKVQISGALNISSNETEMAKWLVAHGPISIGINANAMQFYMGGISHPWKMLCNPTNLDHGVLIVGYGVKDYPLFHKRLPYWIVKNSWGSSWGEQGYYRVFRGDGTCGVNQMASSAVV